MIKAKTAWAVAKAHGVHDGITTRQNIELFIPYDLWENVRGKDLGLIIAAINSAYHAGEYVAEKNVIEAGGIYDSKSGKFRELVK